jgi:hypothetical protein
MVVQLSGSGTGVYVPALRPVGRVAITVAVLCAVVAVSMEVFTFSMWRFVTLTAERVEGTCVVEPPPLAETTMSVAFLTCVFAGMGCAFAALLWIWRARANAEVLSAVPPRLSRWWSVGCWFVPIANLVLPPRVLVDIWAASCAGGERRGGAWIRLVRAWWVAQWTCVILVVLIVLVAEGVVAIDGDRMDGLVVAVLLGLLAVVGHGAAALFAATVLKISADQTRVIAQVSSGTRNRLVDELEPARLDE